MTALPRPGAHGGDGALVASALGLHVDEVLDLSVSLNPCAPDIAQLATRHLDALRRYPTTTDATRTLADAIGADPTRVVLTNGAAHAIELAAARFGGGVADEPEFSLHPRASSGPRWRSDPHNPSGRLAGADASADVWDESFYPLATGRWTAARPSVATIGSLTKVFACPGLRLGYLVADDIEAPTWSVNSLAIALVPELLALAELDKWARVVRERRRELVDVLVRHGLAPEPSDANWVIVRAPGLREGLGRQAVVVRDCASFGLPDHVRIAVPDGVGLERLANALDVAGPHS